jgi:hypothetical protein
MSDPTELFERVTALEVRLRDLEDREGIRELLSLYGFNADVGRVEQYLDCWTDDGLYDNREQRQYRGRTELEELLRSPSGYHKLEIENRSQHAIGNLIIRIEGDTAWAEGYSSMIIGDEEGARLRSAAYNHWDFVRVDGGWRMKRRLRRSIGGETWGGDVMSAYLKPEKADDRP